MTESFDVAVLTLPALFDPSVAIAASRAGGLGVLDLEFAADEAAAGAAVAALVRLGRGRRGVRLGADTAALPAALAPWPDAIGTVVVAHAALAAVAAPLERVRARGVRLLVEVTDGEQAADAERAGAAGLIARGLEAGGFVGEETAFILLQRLLARSALPVWAQGGIGLHSAAACRAGGAAGVVLDLQVALAREAALPAAARDAIARMDGSETACVGEELAAPFRAWSRPGLRALAELRAEAEALAEDGRPAAERVAAWRRAVGRRVGWGEGALWPVGQDAAFAAGLARRFVTVGGIVAGLRTAAREHVRAARAAQPLAEGAPLARSHGTRYPIVQGPMTRVSDRAEFARSVAEGGALPHLALALLRGPEVRALLTEVRAALGERPWGVGILGFVPRELREEQLAVVHEFRPPYALIAGGRPDQALGLERAGIRTYLHVPSPTLLRQFLDGGARRFVFEGRECGGHVGPRSSFALWDAMVDVLLEAVPPGAAADCHVVFAGGVHDARSAAMVAALAAPLAERGMRVGALLGTAYVFTEEAVRDGAVVPAFQAEAVACARTVLLESGPGHATRCAATAFATAFEEERRRLRAAGRSVEEIRDALEALNLGRLRIASKGLARPAAAAALAPVPPDEQRRAGLYMLGQVAALRDRVTTIAALHRDVAAGGAALLERLDEPAVPAPAPAARPADVAVIGMACFMPKAPDLPAFWANVLDKVDAITEIPAERFDWRQYYDPDPAAPDRIYSKWGGFLEPIAFDPARYGMPPASLPSIEPLHLLMLEAVRHGLRDAGYERREFPRERTGVIVGVGGGIGDLGQRYTIRSGLPMYAPDAPASAWDRLPEWTEDSFAGILLNVAAGRVANRFDLGGVNYTVDAACASSLAALYAAVRELEAGTADVMIAAAAETVQSPFGYLAFSKTRALSPRGRCRPFDDSADGIVISEGVAVVVLKRLADAERDGDRVYAVIKAVAGSSDGRDRSMTAPRPEGQLLALQRAYGTAGVTPASVELVEAHGTGTAVGDEAEIAALARMFGDGGAGARWCAVGSVKSQVGHTKCAAGLAGLIKVAKALHHKVLPPTIGVERPNQKARWADGPFYVNTDARPWLRWDGQPRRAGVSAFGFGGTNFHAVVEEYTDDPPGCAQPAAVERWPAELFLLRAADAAGLAREADAMAAGLAEAREASLAALAARAWQALRRPGGPGDAGLTLAIVAASREDLADKLGQARARLAAGEAELHDPRGVYCSGAPLRREGGVAFLFPGQGSQYPDMLRDLAIAFPEVRAGFETASRVLADRLPEPLGRAVFPPPRFSAEEQRAAEAALTRTDVAQPALGAADLGMLRLLARLGVTPDAAAGHSYGEYVALCAAGALDEAALYALSHARGRAIVDTAGADAGAMAAVSAGRDDVAAALDGAADVWIANENAPRQTVISGTRAGVAAAVARLEAAGLPARPVAVACAFHSPLMADASRRFAEHLAQVAFAAPRLPVYANADATAYGADAAALARRLAAHLTSPVRFADQVDAMYQDGARVFVEVGPRGVLTALAQQTLAGRRAAVVATDAPGRHGLAQLLHAVGQLAAAGVAVSLDRLFEGRVADAADPAAVPATAWLVSGGHARPLAAPAAAAARRDAAPAAARAPVAAGAAAGPTVTPGAREAFRAAATADVGSPAPGPAAGPPPAASPADGDAMAQFQALMRQFLETQQAVMLAYLGSAAAAPAAAPSPVPATNGADPLRVEPAAPARNGAHAVPAQPAAPARGATAAAPPPAPRGAVVAAAPSAPAIDEAWLRREVVRIASERTGYPAEMLDLDLNMEADLGIDSIKRVEILGALQRVCPADRRGAVQAAMGALAKARTLRGVIDGAARAVLAAPGAGDAAAPDAPAAPPASPARAERCEAAVPRFALAAVDVPLPAGRLPAVDGLAVLITDDGSGAAAALARRLGELGARPVVLALGAGVPASSGWPVAAAEPVPAAIAAAVAEVRREHGPLAALVHLAPLAPVPAAAMAALEAWNARLALETEALFALLRAVGPDLKRSAGERGAWALAVSRMGGDFGSTGAAGEFFPAQGALAGAMKTLAMEWPSVCAKAIDLDAAAEPAAVATAVLAEMAAPDGLAEVGHRRGRRTALRAVPAPLGARPGAGLDRDAVVLLTGGARGITAEVAAELARRFRPRLVLVGRSPAPAEREDPATAGLASAPEVKRALIADLRRAGEEPSIARVEAACRRVLADREIRRTLARLAELGADVSYHAADARDPAALQGVLDAVAQAYGRLDGVVHGAGVIEDRLVEDKTPESLERVLHTKTDSAFALARLLSPAALRFLVLFGSVAGRFGNRGQADYAAANEVLNKLALHLDRRWPGRVVCVNWGPWDQVGMASAEAREQFTERGIQVIPAAAGAALLVDEILHGAKGEVEIVLGDGPWRPGGHDAAGPAPAGLGDAGARGPRP